MGVPASKAPKPCSPGTEGASSQPLRRPESLPPAFGELWLTTTYKPVCKATVTASRTAARCCGSRSAPWWPRLGTASGGESVHLHKAESRWVRERLGWRLRTLHPADPPVRLSIPRAQTHRAGACTGRLGAWKLDLSWDPPCSGVSWPGATPASPPVQVALGGEQVLAFVSGPPAHSQPPGS